MADKLSRQAGGNAAAGERQVEATTPAELAARALALKVVWHMEFGTRPDGTPKRWSADELGEACGRSERAIRNWSNGTNRPDIDTLSRVLFANNPAHDEARAELRRLWADAGGRASQPRPPSADPLATARAAATTPSPDSIRPPPRCLGRDAEAQPLIDALAAPDPAALLVLGSAGIGKTTLTRHVATAKPVATRFGQRRWFVRLETVTDPATLPAVIVAGVGLDPAGTTFASALAMLAQAPSLLVLDNLETPWEQDQRGVEDVLQALATTPNVSLLASLRGRVAPRAPRWTRTPEPLPGLPDEAARALFLDLAPSAARWPAELARFLAALEGLPLAIDLIAHRAAGDTPLPELWAAWQARGAELADDPDLSPGRETSLRLSLDLSWTSPRLRDPGRRLFRLLGALPAGLSDADRAALLPEDGMEAARQLRATGLAEPRDGRLDLLAPVRAYAQRWHAPEEADAALWCGHFLARARDEGGRILRADGAEALEVLRPEVPNIEAALHAAPSLGRLDAAVAAANGLYRLLSASGLGSPAPLTDLGTACRQADRPCDEARCLFSAGVVAFDRSDHETARTRYDAALLLFRQVRHVLGEAHCIKSLGDIALVRSDRDTARARYQEAQLLYQQVGDVLGDANCTLRLGEIALEGLNYETARTQCEDALLLYQQVGDVLGKAVCIARLGDVALAGSGHEMARERYQGALPLFREVGDVVGEANCILSLGDIALARLDQETARTRYEEAWPLFRKVGNVLGEAHCILSLGDIALAHSDYEKARVRSEAALNLYRQVGNMQGEANCIRSLGDIALARSDHETARAWYEAALTRYREVGRVVGEGNCVLGLGRLEHALEEWDKARTQFQAALALYRRIGARHNEAFALEELASVSDASERLAHHAAARAIWLDIGLPDRAARLDEG